MPFLKKKSIINYNLSIFSSLCSLRIKLLYGEIFFYELFFHQLTFFCNPLIELVNTSQYKLKNTTIIFYSKYCKNKFNSDVTLAIVNFISRFSLVFLHVSAQIILLFFSECNLAPFMLLTWLCWLFVKWNP